MPTISRFFGITIAMFFDDRRDTSRDRAIAMNGLTPDITAVSVVNHGILQLTFADGLSSEVDVLDRMHGPIFEDARTPEGFAKVAVDRETGTVVWPGGADLALGRLGALRRVSAVSPSGLGWIRALRGSRA